MTSDPEAARARAAALSARFEAVRSGLIQYGAGDWLDAERLSALFRAELTAALGKAVRRYYSGQDPRNVARDHEIMAEAYDVARRLDRPDDLSAMDELALRHQGYSEHDVDWIRMCLDRFARADAISDEVCIERLASIGIQPSDTLIEIARNHIHRARAAAHRRAALFVSERVQQAENPVQALLDLPMEMDGPAYVMSPSRAAAAQAAAEPGPFALRDVRRFWGVVDDLVATLKADGRWSGDCTQQRRIALTFGWITGNKRLCDYTHLDVDAFKKGLRRLPASFRFGSPTKGAMSRPSASAFVHGMGPLGGTGGVINYVTKAPSEGSEASLVGSVLGRDYSGGHLDLSSRFGSDGAWGARLNAARKEGDVGTGTDHRHTVAVVALAPPLTSAGARLSIDAALVDNRFRADQAPFGIFPGVAVPPAPDARRNERSVSKRPD